MIEAIKAYDILIERLNENIRGLKAHPKILDKEEHKYLYPVVEKSMYIAICSSDLIIGLKYLDVSKALKNGYETNYFSRNVAHISYELINPTTLLSLKVAASFCDEKDRPDDFFAVSS